MPSHQHPAGGFNCTMFLQKKLMPWDPWGNGGLCGQGRKTRVLFKEFIKLEIKIQSFGGQKKKIGILHVRDLANAAGKLHDEMNKKSA